MVTMHHNSCSDLVQRRSMETGVSPSTRPTSGSLVSERYVCWSSDSRTRLQPKDNFSPFAWFVFADPGCHHRLQCSGACDWFLWVARFASAVHRSTHHHSDRFADRPVSVHHSWRQSWVSLGPVSTVRHLSAYLQASRLPFYGCDTR